MANYRPYDAEAVLDAAAEMAAGGVKPRFYQVSAAVSALATLAVGKRPLIQMPTGTGKSVVMVLLAKAVAKLDQRPQLAGAHREALLGRRPWADDPGSGLMKHFDQAGFEVHLEKAESYVGTWDVRYAERRLTGRPLMVVGSIQTMQGTRADRWNDDEWSMVSYDEVHHAPADTWSGHIARWGDSVAVVGYTATPERAGMAELFELVEYQHEPGGRHYPGMTLRQAIDYGWLVDFRHQVVKIDGWDLSHLRQSTATDGAIEKSLTTQELEAHAETALAPIVRALRLLLRSTAKAIVFCPGVASAHKVAGWLAAHLESDEVERQHAQLVAAGFDAERVAATVEAYGRPIAAGCITNRTSPEERVLSMRRFERWTPGNDGIQVMVVVGVFDEGVDVRDVSQLAFVCPVTSPTRYFQRLGRGSRPETAIAGQLGGLGTAEERRRLIAASSKPVCHVLHFNGHQASKHAVRFVSPARLLYAEMREAYDHNADQLEVTDADLDALLAIEERGDAMTLAELRQKHNELRQERQQAALEARAVFEANEKRQRAARAALVAQPADLKVEDLRTSRKAAKAEREARAAFLHEQAKNARQAEWQEAWDVRVPQADWDRWQRKRLPPTPHHQTPAELKKAAARLKELRDVGTRAFATLVPAGTPDVPGRIATMMCCLAQTWKGQAVRNEIDHWHKVLDPNYQSGFQRHVMKGGRFRRKSKR